MEVSGFMVTVEVGVTSVSLDFSPASVSSVVGTAFSVGPVDGAGVAVVVVIGVVAVVVAVVGAGVIVSDLTVIFSASRPLSLKKADLVAAFTSSFCTTSPRSAKSTEPPSSFAFSFIFAVSKDSSLFIITLPCLRKETKQNC